MYTPCCSSRTQHSRLYLLSTGQNLSAPLFLFSLIFLFSLLSPQLRYHVLCFQLSREHLLRSPLCASRTPRSAPPCTRRSRGLHWHCSTRLEKNAGAVSFDGRMRHCCEAATICPTSLELQPCMCSGRCASVPPGLHTLIAAFSGGLAPSMEAPSEQV